MDGNGRWAKQRGKNRLFGHYEGTESVRACAEYAVEIGVKYLSLFAFSEENWNRPNDEVAGIMSLMVKSVVEEKPVFIKNNIRFLVIGDRTKLSDSLLMEIDMTMQETANNSGLTLIVFLSYSGKWDIMQAAEKYARQLIKNSDIFPLTTERFEQYLSTYGIPDPDLLIRTSGEQRISNFLLWQCAYTEFYFTDTLWPDFRKTQLSQAIDSFNQRERRFGKTSDQMTIK